MLSDRMHSYAPVHDTRDEILVQLYTIRKWATEVAALEADNAMLEARVKGLRSVNKALRELVEAGDDDE